MASTNGLDLSVSGLASGLDWSAVIAQLAQAERAPETLWKQQQTTINQKNAAFTAIKTYLTNLQADIQKLTNPTFFDGRTATSSDAAIATAIADTTTALGSYSFNIIQLATAARINGTGDIAKPISEDGNLNLVTMGTAGFATPVTAGTFTINGQQITVATTDTLQDVFNQIAEKTNVNATYSTIDDTITLTSEDATEIVLGSATDTSNFLQVAHLFNNGTTDPVVSTMRLGSVRLTVSMADAGLKTDISDDNGGEGEFMVNGISITYDKSADSIQNVLDRINASAAGVTATYDANNDRFVVSNKAGGDIGISLQDVTGNFLTATGLAGGTLVHGQNLTYTVNDGPEMVSQSNTITQASSGIAGLSLAVLAEGAVTVNVASDTATIKTAIQSFVDNYNRVQSYIAAQSATSTSSDGKVTAGLLTGDLDASRIVSSLRSLSFSAVSVSGLSTSLDQLADLGIQTSGKDNKVTVDSAALDDGLENSLNAIKSMFSDATNGLAVKLDAYLTSTVGESGTLITHQETLTRQSTNIDTQIANLEKIIKADIAQWTKAFRAMEEAQALVNQQLSYLTQQMTNWNAT